MANSTRLLLVGTLLAPVLLSGCTWTGKDGGGGLPSRQAAGKGGTAVQATEGLTARPVLLSPATVPVPATTDSAFGQCRRELSSLRLITPSAYERRKAEFDQLINRAAVYARVRGDINAWTQDTVDALYQYQTRQLCLRIQRDVVDGLLLRAGSGGG